MKFLYLLVALLPLLAFAAEDAASTKAAAAKERLGTLSSLLEDRANTEAATDLGVGWGGGRRRRRWHVPHGHRPHFHVPHGHRPHFHVPHGHHPHVHVPVEQWARDAILPIPQQLKDQFFPKWVSDILDTLDDIASDPGKAVMQAAKAALEAVNKAIASATAEIKRITTNALDAAAYAVKHYINPVIQELKDIVGQIEAKVVPVSTSVDIINGFSLNMWLCPTSSTKKYSFQDIPQLAICIPPAITDYIKKALAHIYNAITNSNVQWNNINLQCHYNFGMVFAQDGSVSAGYGAGGITGGAGMSIARGLAIGCDSNNWMAGFILAAATFVEIGVGVKSPLEGDLGTSVGVQFFPGEAKCGGWACIPGFTFEFSVQAEGGIMGGELDAAFTIITSVPSFNFGCNAQDRCVNHISFGSCPVCASTNAFCGAIDWLQWISCSGSQICAVQVPSGMYCHGCSWDFMGIAVAFGTSVSNNPIKIEFSLNFAIGFTTMPMSLKIVTEGSC